MTQMKLFQHVNSMPLGLPDPEVCDRPAALQHQRRHDQGSATIFVPRVSGSVQTHRPVNTAKNAAREMPPPSP